MNILEISAINKLRRPEYTGENRCYPCTYLNVAISVVLSLIIGFLVFPPAGAGILVLFFVVIYLRGYLIPGTPTLTQRYFPERVLKWFGKDNPIGPSLDKVSGDVIESGLVDYSDEQQDLVINDEVANRWTNQINNLGQNDIEIRLENFTKSENVEVRDASDVIYVMADGEMTLQRPSHGALVADMAIFPMLSEYLPTWDGYSLQEKNSAMRTIRMFREKCPVCSTNLSLSQTAVESCCTSREVYLLSCPECDIDISEMPV